MWEIALTVAGIALGALLGVAFTSLKDWLCDRLSSHKGIRIVTSEERGPIDREFGFTESAVKVTIMNRSAAAIEIQDIRLMFAKAFGVPVREAPPARSHPSLPATLNPGTAESWYFPAERLASLMGELSPQRITEHSKAKLRPRITTSMGRVYTGPIHQLSVDVNAHWP